MEVSSGFDTQTCIRLAELVRAWKRPLLVTHSRADGDAIGSLIALRSVLRRGGAQPQAVLFEQPPKRYDWLLKNDPIDLFAGVDSAAVARADGLIVVDTCAYAQLEPIASWLKQSPTPKLAVDHHVTRDGLADHYLIDPGASATALIIHHWARTAGWPLDEDARLALYVGMATDTGWFRFANTDARTLESVAELVRDGVSPADVFEKVYQSEAEARFRLLSAVLNNVELHHLGRIAVMSATRETFAQAKASLADTEDLVNYPLQISTVDVSVLLVEHDDGAIRVSFRSKPPSARRPDIDVAAVAAGFNGGGHHRAAAARPPGTLQQVKQSVIERVAAALPAKTSGGNDRP